MLSVPIGAFDIRLLWDYDYGWTIRTSILGSDGITQSELSEMKIEWSHTFVLLHVITKYNTRGQHFKKFLTSGVVQNIG